MPPCSCAFPDRRILITTFLTMIHQARTDKKVSTDKNWGCLLVFRGFWGKKNWVFWVQRMIEDEGRWDLQRKDWRMISSGGFIGFSGFGEDRQIIATSNKTGDFERADNPDQRLRTRKNLSSGELDIINLIPPLPRWTIPSIPTLPAIPGQTCPPRLSR